MARTLASSVWAKQLLHLPMPDLLSNLTPLDVGRIKINLRSFSSVTILKESIPCKSKAFLKYEFGGAK